MHLIVAPYLHTKFFSLSCCPRSAIRSTGVFVFFYAVFYFYVRSNMSGSLQVRVTHARCHRPPLPRTYSPHHSLPQDRAILRVHDACMLCLLPHAGHRRLLQRQEVCAIHLQEPQARLRDACLFLNVCETTSLSTFRSPFYLFQTNSFTEGLNVVPTTHIQHTISTQTITQNRP
jgi:hypothetical protein